MCMCSAETIKGTWLSGVSTDDRKAACCGCWIGQHLEHAAGHHVRQLVGVHTCF